MGLLVNGIAVLSGKLAMPRVGRWTADFVLDAEIAPTGKVVVTNDDVTTELTGAVRRGGEYTQVGHVTLVGGSGGLESIAPAVYYRSVTVKTPLVSLLQSVGEKLSDTSDEAALGTYLPRWTRELGHGGTALARLAGVAKCAWRVLDDGTIWLGNDAYQETGLSEDDYETIGVWPSEFRTVIGTEDVPFLLRPGQTFQGKRVSFVEYEIESGYTTTTVWGERDAPSSHPVLGPIQSIVRHTMREVRYHAMYLATVVAQRADDSLDVRFEDDALPPMTEVPLMKFAPSIAVKVSVGARVLIAFAGGNPSDPVAVMWVSGVTERIPVKTCGRIDLRSTSPGTLIFAYTPPGGVEQTTSMALTTSGGPGPVTIVVPPGAGADLAGRIGSE